jgi:aspartate/methionine/tyrosine aminotransferase
MECWYVLLGRLSHMSVLCCGPVLFQVYQLLSFPRVPLSTLPPPLYYYNPLGSDDRGNLISMGSFSKMIGPGLRLGWIQAPPWIIRRLAACGVCDSGGGFNPIVSGIVQSAIDLNLQDEYVQQRSVLKFVYLHLAHSVCVVSFLPIGT